jgi:hypothetical protein
MKEGLLTLLLLLTPLGLLVGVLKIKSGVESQICADKGGTSVPSWIGIHKHCIYTGAKND